MKRKKPLQGLNVVFIGAGNVADHLSALFAEAGATMVQTVRKSTKTAGKKFSKSSITDIKKLKRDADLYVLAVPDDAIAGVVKSMPALKGTVVHTSGTIGMDALKKFASRGVFYPLQSFSKEHAVTITDFPICIEGSSKQVVEALMECAGGINKNAYVLDSAQREVVHLAAVFANNFSNHMFAIADDILAHSNISFDLVRPLILETAFKAMDMIPADAQTGPAFRGDKKIVKHHAEMLKSDDDIAKLYKQLSKSISRSSD